jgi:hypothetical protein
MPPPMTFETTIAPTSSTPSLGSRVERTDCYRFFNVTANLPKKTVSSCGSVVMALR